MNLVLAIVGFMFFVAVYAGEDKKELQEDW